MRKCDAIPLHSIETLLYHIIDGNPMPVRDYSTAMQVVAVDESRSRIVWTCKWEPDGVSEEEARAAVARLYTGVLVGAKANIERRCG